MSGSKYLENSRRIMSCMNNIDPYNNSPANRKKPTVPFQQYEQPMQPQAGSQRSGSMTRRPEFTGNVPNNMQYMQPSAQPQFQAPAPHMDEAAMLRSDLNTAINYIHSLGGQWPPPSS